MAAWNACAKSSRVVIQRRQRLLQALTVDCANGVGAQKLKALAERLSGTLDVNLRSTGEGGLNFGCGADFVQKERRFPAGMKDCQDGARSGTALQKSCLSGHASQSQIAAILRFKSSAYPSVRV